MSRPRRSPPPAAVLAFVFCLSLLGSLAVGVVAGPPVPAVHDEFSYLVAADTYARGRLANPALPHWQHFVSPHVIQQPTYASKYQPAQGAVLALGQRLTGDPVWGVWLSAALMTAAITWMLQGWLPARWAFLGGVLTALNFGMGGDWAQSYWGGAVPAAGGALVFGGIGPRRLNSRSGSWAFAAGAGILALSRPFEGVVVVLVALSFTLIGRTRLSGAGFRRLAAAVGVAAVLGGAFFFHFNRVVTGDPWTMPYSHLTAVQEAAPLFIFQDLPEEPEYVDEHVRRFFTEWTMEWYTLQREGPGALIAGAVARPVVSAVGYLLGPVRNGSAPPFWFPSVLILPLLLPLHLLRRWDARRALVGFAVLFAALTFVTYFLPYYVAVLTSLWMLLVALTLRILRVVARRTRLRSALVPGAVLLSLLLLVPTVAKQRGLNRDPAWFPNQKVDLTGDLVARGGEHLVLVSYAADYDLHTEWVYNSAELSEQPVIWARSLDPEQDGALLRYYGERRGWRLHLQDGVPPQLRPIDPDGPAP